jgi:uncharacterized protein YycO
MEYSKRYNLLPGDDVKEAIFQTGFSKHHAVYLGVDPTGTEWVAENQMFKGVRLVRARDYFSSSKKYVVVPFKGTNTQREQAVKRALSKIGAPYNLINYNCEHYASYVQTGRPQSKQVGNAIAAASLAVLVILFVKSVNNSR